MGYHLMTNWQARPLCCKADMPEKAARDFDYVDDDDYSSRFVEYRGAWYDVNDCQAIAPVNENRELPIGWSYPVYSGEPLAHFDCIVTDSYFSAVAFRFVDDGESVICCRIYS